MDDTVRRQSSPVPAAAALAPDRRVAAVIPVLNETQAIASVLAEVRALEAGVLDDVIVVDAHSTDGTPDVARAGGARVVEQQRRGYGAACWEGARAAVNSGATIVVFLDGDGSDPPAALPRLLAPLLDGSADLVLGVRCRPPGERDPVPWHARLGNALVCRLLRWRTGRAVSDLPSMKAIHVERLRALEMAEMGYGWTTEMVAKALARALRVREVPIAVRPRAGGVSKVSGNLRASVRAALALVRAALNASRPLPP